jgi:hypothetical protein
MHQYLQSETILALSLLILEKSVIYNNHNLNNVVLFWKYMIYNMKNYSEGKAWNDFLVSLVANVLIN